MSAVMRQPTLFLPHGGSPCFFMDWQPSATWARHRAFLQHLPATLPARPQALLVISAHWETACFTLQKQAAPSLLFDYDGFPPHTYALTWPALGAPWLADQAASLLAAAGLDCEFDTQRGYDHGVFVPLKIAFPQADIPCLQLSLRSDLDSGAHLAVGRALAPLREQGVLIIGSGNSYHNMAVMMRAMRTQNNAVQGVEFDTWLTASVTCSDPIKRVRRLAAWSSAPSAREAVPREEHLLPLHVVAGAAGKDCATKIFEDVVMGGVQSAFRFG